MSRSLLGRGIAILMIAIVVAGCASTTSTGGSQGSSPAGGQSQLLPPAAPTNLNAWREANADPNCTAYCPDSAHFSWTAPAGPLTGYYIHYEQPAMDYSPPPAVCGNGSDWTTLPASATTWEIAAVEQQPNVYICAVNAAGTSPTVQFPQAAPADAG